MKEREALLPATDALTTATVESIPYRGGRLVRYRTRSGFTFRQEFKKGYDPAEPNERFWEFVEKLRQEGRGAA